MVHGDACEDCPKDIHTDHFICDFTVRTIYYTVFKKKKTIYYTKYVNQLVP